MRRRSISTWPFPTTGAGRREMDANPYGGIEFRVRSSKSSKGTGSSGAATGIISIPCISNTAPNSLRRLQRQSRIEPPIVGDKEAKMVRKLVFVIMLGMATIAGTPGRAQELIESYIAFLSEADHFNSNGQRLTSAAAIIRQD